MFYIFKMHNIFERLGVILFVFVCVESSKLPSDFKRCETKDIPCLKGAIQDALPKLKDGIPDIGIPSFDPIRLPTLTIGKTQVMDFDQNYRNVEIFGLSGFDIVDLNFDLEKGKLEMGLVNSTIEFNATYYIKGRVFQAFEIYGDGQIMIRVGKIKGKLSYDIETFSKNGEKYLRGTKVSFPATAGLCEFILDNLFDGNKQLGDNINYVLNDNWKELWEEVGQTYVDVIAEYTLKFMNKFFDKIPISAIFLDQIN